MQVVKNRVASKRYPNTFCEVVTQYKQFSWYNDHVITMPDDPIKWEEYILHVYRNDPIELRAWQDSFWLAYQSYFSNHEERDITKGSLFYMTTDEYQRRGLKSWNNTEAVAVIGNHIFFKPCKGKSSCLSF